MTGALEVGAKFAANGVCSIVLSGSSSLPDVERSLVGAWVLNTETRHVAAAEAAQRVFSIAQAGLQQGFNYIYKKTDSTLRGNIGAELGALVGAASGAPVLYVPAYPRMGRTVRDGCLYVDGVPVGATTFGKDPLNPVAESHIPTLLAGQCEVEVRVCAAAGLLENQQWGITVYDGESDADLEAAAKAFISSTAFRLAAGPSGFATHLSRWMNLPRSAPSALPKARRGLVVNGSLHVLSLRQLEQAKRDGFRSINSRSIPPTLAEEGWIILEHVGDTAHASVEFGMGLARVVCDCLARSPVDAVVIFGGDTAHAIVKALGNPSVHPIGEVMEGIPISRIEAKDINPNVGHGDRGLIIVTKAGGFGPIDVLARIRSLLTEG